MCSWDALVSPYQDEPSPAATIILLRSKEPGFEVLMVQRENRGFFGGLMVFPGGGVDPIDHGELAGLVVKSSHEDRSHRSAALRELGEETGILLEEGRAVRAPVGKGESFYRALHESSIVLDADRIVLVSRWVTPEGAPRRFDARFYVAAVDDAPPVLIDRDELIGHHWVTPTQALALNRGGEWPMFLPTVAHLRWLERKSSPQDAVRSARGADGRTLVEPKRMEDGSIVPLLLPVDGP